MEHISAKFFTARLPHHCILCGGGIAPGDRYCRHVYKDGDGRMRSYCLHHRCQLIANEYKTATGSAGFTAEAVDRWLRAGGRPPLRNEK